MGWSAGVTKEVESISVTWGLPHGPGMVCDTCNANLEPRHLVAAIGVWSDYMGLPNRPGWEVRFIQPLTDVEVRRYMDADIAAQEMREDDGEV